MHDETIIACIVAAESKCQTIKQRPSFSMCQRVRFPVMSIKVRVVSRL
jgi:hypothetical protein